MKAILFTISLFFGFADLAAAQHEQHEATPKPAAIVAKPKKDFIKQLNESRTQVTTHPKIKPSATISLQDGETLTLTAASVREQINGKWVTRLAYNGMIPGPTLLVKQGTKIKVKLVNKTGVPTTLHSHGLRVDDRNDGVPGIGQEAIPNGGNHTYDLVFPDHGLFWYHPHVREDVTQEMGLYGSFLVVPKDPSPAPIPNREEVLAIDDLLVTPKGLPAFSDHHTSYALMGRYGNQLMVNNSMKWSLTATQGETIRFYLVNTANARPFRIRFANARMKVVGGDNGYYEKEFFADDVLLSPSERIVVDVLFDKLGKVELQHVPPGKPTVLAKISVERRKKKAPRSSTDSFELLHTNPAVTADLQTVRALQNEPPSFTLNIDAKISGEHAEHMMSHPASDGIEWEDAMGEMSADMTESEVQWLMTDAATNKTNMDIQWVFRQGVPVKVRIANTGKHHPMHHPVHFHGQRFAVLARNNKPETNLVWKDTVLVPAGQTVDVVLDNLNPGRWMGHCHIAEHLNVGMMFGFSVTSDASKTKSAPSIGN